MTRRILSSLLAALFVLSAAACSSGDDVPANTGDETTPAVTTEETTTEPPETKYELAVKNADYKGAAYNVLSMERQAAGKMYQYIDIDWAEELEGDVYNDAVHTRNQMIEEDYKVVIKVEQVAKPKDTLTNLVSAGDTTYSLASFKMNEILAVGQAGGVQDVTKLDALQLDAPWWDEALFRDLTIGSKKFMLTGDGSVLDEEMLYVVFCNKKLIKDNNMQDPYEIVRQGKWTLDKLHDMAKGVNKDMDGNGIFDEKDMYGFGSDFSTAALLFYAAGGSIAVADKDGAPQLSLMTEKNAEIVERVATFHNDKSSVANASQINGSWTALSNMLMEDRLLFRQGNVYNIPGYREMISDFGVLPLPKYTEDQENYRHVVASQYATAFSLPATLSGEALERACVILTAINANSEDAVVAYYEVNLKSKNARDAASADMLEIIFNSKCYDLGKTFDWAKMETNAVTNAIKAPGTFVSKYDANKEKAATEMVKTYEFFK